VEAEVRRGGYRVVLLPGDRFPARVLALRRLIRSEGPAMMHTVIFEANQAGRLAAAGTGVPVLSSLVNMAYGPERRLDPGVRPGRLRAVRLIDGLTARHLTAHFHAITEAVKRAAVATLGIPASRITVVERGRDPDRLGRAGEERRRRTREALGLADSDEVVLAVGRQEYQKGHRYLLEAAELLAAARPRLRVLVAGRSGNASPQLDALRSGPVLRDRIRLLGHRGDVPDLLAAADVFAFPSLFEGLGGVLIEAMALERPIVATDLAPVREVVEGDRAARLVPPASPPDLARALSELLDRQAVAEALGRAGREIFERRFTLGRSTARMVALYRRVVARRATEPGRGSERGPEPRVG
jgi:glycosyltransferase involved in cell wall biosynthesis